MVPWHQRLPLRMAAELQAAREAGLRLRFERHAAGIVGWRGTIEVDGQRHFLQVLYPTDFPVRPPWVRETEALTEEVINDKATYHQMADGSLCLFAMASVIGHAEQGRVQRVLPGHTPCYECISLQQRRHPERFFRARDAAPAGPPAMAGYRQPGIPGIGLDVEAVAIMTARLALQTLSRLGGGAPDYPDAEHDHLVWTSRPDAAFDHPLQVRWERYERDPDCRICGSEFGTSAALGDDAAGLAELEAALSDPARLVLDEIPTVFSPDCSRD